MNESFDLTKNHEQKIKHLNSLIFKPPILPICSVSEHQSLILQAEYVCLKSTCKNYTQKFCQMCSHPISHLFSIKKIVPILSKFVQQKWDQVRRNNIQIQKQWRICQVNIKYCIDILDSVHKTITQSKNTRLKELPVYENIIDIVLDMHREGSGVDGILNSLQLLNSKYGIFQKSGKNSRDQNNDQKYKSLDDHCVQKDIQFRNEKWLRAGEKTKLFSQKALLFSQTLAQLIQDRIKYEKRKKNLDHLTASKIVTLKQILQLYSNQNQNKLAQKVQSLSCLKIQLESTFKDSKSNSRKFFEQKLNICTNLQSILINNKNGKITSQVWQPLTANFQALHKLKQLKLHLRYEDILLLTEIFKQKPKRVRNISVLHLTLSDEPKLQMKKIAQFCNTLQLSQLYLTLTRNNINKNNFIDFLNTLRFRTSLSSLPMNVLDINLTKNKITQKQIPECQRKFTEKYIQIKKKMIAF